MTNAVLDPRDDKTARPRVPRTRAPALSMRLPSGSAPVRRAVLTLAQPRIAVAVAVLGTGLLMLVGVASPNEHTLDTRLPLSLLPAMPGAAATYVTASAIGLQLVGLLGMLAAHTAGWRPRHRRLLAAGAVAVAVFSCLSPVGSGDVASYAAYGRLAALGADPYTAAPDWLGGAYAHLVSASWMHTPTVYGPLATWIQQGAAMVGGSRPWLTIWVLMMANAVVFLAVGLLLVRVAENKSRAALLWAANPLLIGQLVGGGHLDTYTSALGILAVMYVRRGMLARHDLVAGAFLGLACGVKVSAALLGLGLVWPLLRVRCWGRALRLSAAGVVTVSVLYAGYGLHALAPLSSASSLVSVPSIWEALQWLGQWTFGTSAAASDIGMAWPLLLLLVAFVIQRRVPLAAPALLAFPFTLVFAWILVAPWCMPWYTALAWPLAALLPRSPMTRWLAVATAVLALAHNTGGHGWTW
jgi:hypothetical protein